MRVTTLLVFVLAAAAGTARAAAPRPAWAGSRCQVHRPPSSQRAHVSRSLVRELRARRRARALVLLRPPASGQYVASDAPRIDRRREKYAFALRALETQVMECLPGLDRAFPVSTGDYRSLWMYGMFSRSLTYREAARLARSGWVEAILRDARAGDVPDVVPASAAPFDEEAGDPRGGPRIGIVDTGVAAHLHGLADRVEAYRDFTGDALGAGGVFDSHGRGSAVAGHVVARYGPATRLRVARVFRDATEPQGRFLSDLLAGLQWVVDLPLWERPTTVFLSGAFMERLQGSAEGRRLRDRLQTAYRVLGVTLSDSDHLEEPAEVVANLRIEPQEDTPREITPEELGEALEALSAAGGVLGQGPGAGAREPEPRRAPASKASASSSTVDAATAAAERVMAEAAAAAESVVSPESGEGKRAGGARSAEVAPGVYRVHPGYPVDLY